MYIYIYIFICVKSKKTKFEIILTRMNSLEQNIIKMKFNIFLKISLLLWLFSNIIFYHTIYNLISKKKTSSLYIYIYILTYFYLFKLMKKIIRKQTVLYFIIFHIILKKKNK